MPMGIRMSALGDAQVARDRLLARTAAAMYAGAALLGVLEALTPGGPGFSMIPPLIALVVSPLVIVISRRVSRPWLALLAPIGVVLIADAVASTGGIGDGAVLYVWPVVWAAWFFGWRVTAATVATVGVAHALVLMSMPPGLGYFDRWLDVMMTVTIVAAVVRLVADHNQKLVDALVEEARVDALTGLLNRRGFEERAPVELARSRREQSMIAVASFDLDHFKAINDEHGHDIGDQVLTQFGQVLREQARGIDLLARMGGEEFVVLLSNCDLLGAYGFAERVRKHLAVVDPPITTSAGVAVARAPVSVTELLRQADVALYQAKDGGRDQTVTAAENTPLLK
jgi:diguanylate cyclase (GGDEF)-like protein